MILCGAGNDPKFADTQRILRQSGGKMHKSGTKMREDAPILRQDAPIWRQHAPTWRQHEPGWLHLGPSRRHLEPSWVQLASPKHFGISRLQKCYKVCKSAISRLQKCYKVCTFGKSIATTMGSYGFRGAKSVILDTSFQIVTRF